VILIEIRIQKLKDCLPLRYIGNAEIIVLKAIQRPWRWLVPSECFWLSLLLLPATMSTGRRIAPANLVCTLLWCQ